MKILIQQKPNEGTEFIFRLKILYGMNVGKSNLGY